MSKKSGWWEHIGSALQLQRKLTDAAQDGRSLIFHHADPLPWRDEFYEGADLRRSAVDGVRCLQRMDWEKGADPGAFILAGCCDQRTRQEIWVDEDPAEYLGVRDKLILSEYYVWITGIVSEKDLKAWDGFVQRYTAAAGSRAHAIFLLEYEGAKLPPCRLETVEYRVEPCDCRVFALEYAEMLANTELRDYQAELALRISGRDPELCCALLEAGEELMHAPVGTSRVVSREKRNSCGRPFRHLGEEVSNAAWEANLVSLFPAVERYRSNLVARYYEPLKSVLPITDNWGQVIDDPLDLEFSDLLYIMNSRTGVLPPEAKQAMLLCRRVRNDVAHLRLTKYEDIAAILAGNGLCEK